MEITLFSLAVDWSNTSDITILGIASEDYESALFGVLYDQTRKELYVDILFVRTHIKL